MQTEHKDNQAFFDKIYEERDDMEMVVATVVEGFNHYSKILSGLISSVPSIDHPFIFSLLRSYADAIEKHHPGTADMANATELLVGHQDICIKIPAKR